MYRELGPTELYLNQCHNHGNRNIGVTLTLHTRTPLDLGEVKVGLQEMQHQNPQLTCRIKQIANNKTVFAPMECPVLPLDTEFECKDFLHEKFNTETGPLWRVQIVTLETFERANIRFGPEVEAILEDDSSVETRWRYFLRYMQGQLNSDIENFGGEDGRSVILLTFHPSITDVPGALNLAREFMDILDMKMESREEPLSLGGAVGFPQAVESILPQPDSVFHLTDLVPMVKAVGNHFLPALRRSPCNSFLVNNCATGEGASHCLRGWLTARETRELSGICEEEEIGLQGILLAAALTAMARTCVQSGVAAEESRHLRACISSNLRQFSTQAIRNGVYSSVYEESSSLPIELISSQVTVTATHLWKLANQLSAAHTNAKANKFPLRHIRMVGKMHSAGSMDSAFKDMKSSRRVDNDLHFTHLGDIGHVFRIAGNSDDESKVRLEDVMVLVSGQNMGYPLSHSAHLFRGRLNYTLVYYTNYIEASTAFLIRDETINLLRLAAEPM